uniref:Uncharacterized protein n=1 Tax=Chromera velia CCMP2878 TaxID=1169474 RepID=A0A0G4F753_9ALVE|eukprot:Cvel_15372.t1-p1 / transcript=Cvel_15372.t1 / gene=Cvel_15372 / organism=Chromera_velia_CCMP2878 / gene_product=hypothetical protein / transcript_product=hypothetical protein / location=Cvel_scaffold1133:31111-38089(+) / protein_length=613 / sequence_SO=supercontig / SO=protein_coding / is_pseudo=false
MLVPVILPGALSEVNPKGAQLRRRRLRTDTEYTSKKDEYCSGVDLSEEPDSTAQSTLDTVGGWTDGIEGFQCASYTTIDEFQGGTIENKTAADYFMGLTEAKGNLSKLETDLKVGSDFVNSVDAEIDATSSFKTKYDSLVKDLGTAGETSILNTLANGNAGQLYATREVAYERFSSSGSDRASTQELAASAASGLEGFEAALDGLGSLVTNNSDMIDTGKLGVQIVFYLLFTIGLFLVSTASLELACMFFCKGLPLKNPRGGSKFPRSCKACTLWVAFLSYAFLLLFLGGILMPLGVVVGDFCNFLSTNYYTAAQINSSSLLTGQVADIAASCLSSDGDRDLMGALGIASDFEFKDEMRTNLTTLRALYPAGNLVPYSSYPSSSLQSEAQDLDDLIDGTTSGDADTSGALYKISENLANAITYPLDIMDLLADGLKCGSFFTARQNFTNVFCGKMFSGLMITGLMLVVIGYLSIVLFGVFYSLFRFIVSSKALEKEMNAAAARKATEIAVAPPPQVEEEKEPEKDAEEEALPPPEPLKPMVSVKDPFEDDEVQQSSEKSPMAVEDPFEVEVDQVMKKQPTMEGGPVIAEPEKLEPPGGDNDDPMPVGDSELGV